MKHGETKKQVNKGMWNGWKQYVTIQYRLAKARVAGSNPVSCSSLRSGIIDNSMVPIFLRAEKTVYRQKGKIKRPCGLEFFEGVGTLSSPLKCYE